MTGQRRRVGAMIAVSLLAAVGAWLVVRAAGPDGGERVAAERSSEPAAPERVATFERRSFTELNSSEAARGSLRLTDQRSYDGSYAAEARYHGGPGNGFARGIWDVAWRDGDDVWYGAAFYLPRGFKEAMQGEVAIMRWDNHKARGSGGDVGGVVLWGSDRQARLVLARYRGRERVLVGPFWVPEGRWFSLLVHQRLDRRSGYALNEVYVGGHLTGSSALGNTAGRAITRLRYGIVALSSNVQINPLLLWFDRALAESRRRGGPDDGQAERAWATAPEIDRGLRAGS